MAGVVVVTGASSGFGALASRALARAGYTVYAGLQSIKGKNYDQVEEIKKYSADNKTDLRSVELDVVDDASVESGISKIIKEAGRLDVVVHNAGHMSYGPAEAFTVEQCAQLYDVNVLGTQRINRVVLPHMRARRQGLLVWVGSSSTRGATTPFFGPYFAAKAAMDAMAVSYASELTRWGVDTSIVIPGAFTKGTNHFAHGSKPEAASVAKEYFEGPYKGVDEQILRGVAALAPPDADVGEVANAIVNVVNTPAGKRPFRVHVDPNNDGSEVVCAVGDRVRSEMYRRLGLEDLLTVQTK
ncbi:short-chain alcohol dehydrogenase [Xylogone sp. PMI_703]|nr:short-chain alcohol dehydrogenase [Xylogone sp. PMI_703]